MKIGRRSVLQSLATSAAFASPVASALAADSAVPRPERRILIKGGYVATVDKSFGEIAGGMC